MGGIATKFKFKHCSNIEFLKINANNTLKENEINENLYATINYS